MRKKDFMAKLVMMFDGCPYRAKAEKRVAKLEADTAGI